MIEFFFAAISFYATGFGVLLTAATAALIILLWDWRVALAGLVLLQLGVAGLVVQTYQYPSQWMAVQVVVICLCALMLALSSNRVSVDLLSSRPGNWVSRGAAIVLFTIGWWLFDIVVTLPGVDQLSMDLFTWLVLCALLLLSLSQNPLFVGIALLVWCLVMQGLTALLLDIPSIGLLIGIVELLLALACSYLVLFVPEPEPVSEPVLTDISFADFDSVPSNGLTHEPLPRLPAPVEPPTTDPQIATEGSR